MWKNPIKAMYILKDIEKSAGKESTTRTPASLSAENQIITFISELNRYNPKNLYNFLIKGDLKSLEKIHKEYFKKKAPRKNRFFYSQKSYEEKMQRIINDIHENGKDKNQVEVIDHNSFNKRKSLEL
jgi:hypothetical protein